jgi:hypothetical protein
MASPPRLAAAGILLLAACGGGGGNGGPSGGGPSPSPSQAPSARFAYNGLDHVSWWHDQYGYAEATSSRRELVATGANWAGVLVTWYMPTRSSTTIDAQPSRTPTDDVVRHAIRELRASGVRVMLKPHVDVEDGTWRGAIAPADTAAWFASYRTFASHYAGLAEDEGVALFCVGTELATLSRAAYAAEWEGVIGAVKTRYRGPLTYAANANTPGDEFTSVSFWRHLDVLGLDVYTPLTSRTNPTRGELVQAWTRNRDGNDMVGAYRNWQAAWGKPVIFTEIGYRSGDGANRAPWDFDQSLGPDPGEQADCYAAAYEVWSRETAWMQGVFWWSWSVPAPLPGDTGYDPRDKPAEDILRQRQGP